MMDAIDLIYFHEGFRPLPYCDKCGHTLLKSATGWSCDCVRRGWDCGNITVGAGFNVSNGVTSEDARGIVARRCALNTSFLHARQPVFARLDVTRQQAILDMAYQLGVAGLLGFHDMWDALGAGNYEAAAQAVGKSRYAEQVPARAARIMFIVRNGVFPTIPGVNA